MEPKQQTLAAFCAATASDAPTPGGGGVAAAVAALAAALSAMVARLTIGKKGYQEQEAAMQLAVSADPSLWNYAFERNVVITGEQNLFSLLRLLQIAWTQQRQAENQEQVFGLANQLVERVGLFAERFEKIGKDVDSLQASFENARKAMNGNRGFVSSARRLVDIGAKENPKRRLPDEDM